MLYTTRLKLPYLTSGQSQKHVIVNESLRKIDAVMHLCFQEHLRNDPPPAPLKGQRYTVGNAPTGEWSKHAGEIAVLEDEAWIFFTPQEGWLGWVTALEKAIIFNNGRWALLTLSDSTPSPSQNMEFPRIGVNASSDETNRLVVKSENILFSHDEEKHSNDVYVKINKAHSQNKAVILYQNAYTGRAEIGLNGNDNFTIKMSEDGASWKEAVAISAEGKVSFPQTPLSYAPYNLLKDSGRFGKEETLEISTFMAPPYLSLSNGSTFSEGEKFIHDNTTYDVTGLVDNDGNLPKKIKLLIEKTKKGAARKLGFEFYTLKVTAGSKGNDRTINQKSFFLPFQNTKFLLPQRYSVNFHVYVESGQVALSPRSKSRLYIDGLFHDSSHEISYQDGWRQITRLYENEDPSTFSGYDVNLFEVYATPNSVFHIATPTITPCLLSINNSVWYGLIPSTSR